MIRLPPAGRGRISRRATLVGASSLLLHACTATLPGQGPEPKVYRLSRKSAFGNDLPRADWSLAVAEPSAERTLDTNRIAVIRDGTRVEYYADAIWVDRAPHMLQSLIVQSMLASNRIAQVGTDRDRLRADFLLRSDLRAFNARESGNGGARTARVVLGGQLLRLPRREVVARSTFEQELPITGRGLDDIVAVFDEALGRVLKDLVVWALKSGSTLSASAPARRRPV